MSTTQETVEQVVGKARETIESIAPRVPKRASIKKMPAPEPEPLEKQEAPRKVHGDALATGSGSAPAKKSTAKKTAAKKTTAKKTTAKKTAAKKTAAKKTAAKKTAAKKTAAKKKATG